MRRTCHKARGFYLILLTLVASLLMLRSAPLLAATPSVVTPAAILVHGDSLSAGYGIDPAEGWVMLLAQRIQREFPGQFTLINSSVSGETSSGGLARLPQLLSAHQPVLVLIELGGNDGLQGQPLALIKQNLAQMLTLVKAANAQAVLIGMQIPPNYGPRYSGGFHALFSAVATDAQVPLVPFLLENIATDPNLMQRDGIHPTAAAQPQLVDTVWPVLLPQLAALASASTAATTASAP